MSKHRNKAHFTLDILATKLLFPESARVVNRNQMELY
jgi:hypothetical protein